MLIYELGVTSSYPTSVILYIKNDDIIPLMWSGRYFIYLVCRNAAITVILYIVYYSRSMYKNIELWWGPTCDITAGHHTSLLRLLAQFNVLHYI